MICNSASPSRHGQWIPGRWIAVVAAALLVSCKAMPSHMEREVKAEAKLEAQAQETLTETETDLDQLDREKREIEREGMKLRAKRDRFVRVQETLRLFGVKETDAAESQAREILSAAGTKVIDAKQFDFESDLLMPSLEPAEEATLRAVLGAVHINRGEVAEAIEQCGRAHELDPTNRFARQNLGLAYFQRKDYEEAIEVFEKELRDGYRSGSILFLVAQAHYEVAQRKRALDDSSYRNHFEVARVALSDAFLEDPNNKEVRRYSAVIALESGRYDEAIPLFRAILGDDPFDASYLAQLGQCYIQTEQYRRAADQFEFIAHIGKANSDTYEVLGDIYRTLGFPGRAAHWFAEAKGGSVDGVDADQCFEIGYLFKNAKQVDAARKWLEAVPVDSEVYFDAQLHLGYLLLDTGEEARGLASLDQARQQRPDEGSLHLTCADRFLDRKELDRAFAAYTSASAIDATAAEGLAGLGEVAYERGNLELAIGQYEKAQQRDPEDARYRVILEQLKTEREVRKVAKETPK